MRHPNHLPPSYPPQQLRKARTCDDLGVCQRPLTCKGKQCVLADPLTTLTTHTTQTTDQTKQIGQRGQPQRIPLSKIEAGNVWFADLEPPEKDNPTPFDQISYWLLCLVAYALALICAGYAWHRYGPAIKAAIVTIWGM